jgi:hypothetical protein
VDYQEIEQLAQLEAVTAAENLADLLTVTGGNRNVALATLHEVGTNLADALNPLIAGTSQSPTQQRRSSTEGDVHMLTSHSGASSAHQSAKNSSATHASGSGYLGGGVNQMHVQKVNTHDKV